jgi:hypothetical protein
VGSNVYCDYYAPGGTNSPIKPIVKNLIFKRLNIRKLSIFYRLPSQKLLSPMYKKTQKGAIFLDSPFLLKYSVRNLI